MYDATKTRWGKVIQHYGAEENPRGLLELIYGEFGSGKTSYAASAKDCLFIDVDRGDNIATRAAEHPYKTFEIDGLYENVKLFMRDMLDRKDVFDPEGGPYAGVKTLVIDSWTKLNEGLLVEIAGRDILEQSRPDWDAYMRLKNRQVFLMGLLKEIAYKRGINIIVTALPVLEGDEAEKMKRDEKKASIKSGFSQVRGMPNLVGGYKKIIGAEFDEVHFLETYQAASGVVRRMWTVPHNDYLAKSRLGLPSSIENPTFPKMLELAAEALAKRKNAVTVK